MHTQRSHRPSDKQYLTGGAELIRHWLSLHRIIFMHTPGSAPRWATEAYVAGLLHPWVHYQCDQRPMKVEDALPTHGHIPIKKEQATFGNQREASGGQSQSHSLAERSHRNSNPVADIKAQIVDGNKVQEILQPQSLAVVKLQETQMGVSHEFVVETKEERPVQPLIQEESLEKESPDEESSEEEQMAEDSSDQVTQKLQKRCLKRRDRYDRQEPNRVILQKFGSILDSTTENIDPQSIVEGYEKKLKAEMQREAEEPGAITADLLKRAELARKNITQKYMRIFRLVLRILDETLQSQDNMGMLQTLLSRSLTSIPAIMKIYREPAFQFFVSFLKKEVVTLQRFPHFIMALPVKPIDHLMMLGGISGMVYAINNPHLTPRSWYFDPKLLIEDTTHIAQAVREHKIDNEEVIKMLQQVCAKVASEQKRPKPKTLYSNIASRVATIIQHAIVEIRTLGLTKKQEQLEIKKASKRMIKSPSIITIKEMLAFETLRSHLKTNFIDSRRMILDILEDPSLNCRTKLGIMGSYESFSRAVMDPNTLKRWK